MFECRNCQSHRSEPLYRELRDRFHGHDGTFNYVECADCGLTQIEQVPPNIGDYYGDYRVHGGDSALYRLLRRLTIGHCYIEPPGDGRAMLDVGCGNGWYLQEMARRGWKPVGYEFDPVYAANLAERLGLPVISGDAALDAHHDQFDLVTLNFAFEHLDQPRQLLDRVIRCLKPGGQIYMSVPNIESREAAMFKERWFHLDPPRHISFFTKQQLTRILADRGFSNIQTKNLPMPTGLSGSVSYWLWGKFEPLTWYALTLPGLLFMSVVRDGNFAISGRRSN